MISVTIITKNEENNIARCISSVDWADEIIIIDSGSTDNTLSICNKLKCRVIQTEWKGFGNTKQIGVDACNNKWILSIDADEEVSTELRDNILSAIKQETYSAYKIRRTSYYLSKRIKHCGWDNDYPLRLFQKKHGHFNSETVHESVIIDNNSISSINAPLFHHPYPSLEHHLSKVNLYTTLGAKKYQKEGKKSSLNFALLSGLVKFIKMYILKKGFLDGKEGLILCSVSAYGAFIKYTKLWLLTKQNIRN